MDGIQPRPAEAMPISHAPHGVVAPVRGTFRRRPALSPVQRLGARRTVRGTSQAPGSPPATFPYEPRSGRRAPQQATPGFSLDNKSGLSADQAESAIKQHLDQRYHRFVSQAVNDMEFGRGTATGRPGLLHASAGIPGVGSCSVFFTRDNDSCQIRIQGIGYHVHRATYRLTYANSQLGRRGSRLRIS